MTRFQLGVITLQFNCDPVHPAGLTARRFQPEGRYSDGRVVIYDKSALERDTHRLRFTCINDATLENLRNFMRYDAKVTAKTFTWFDHNDVQRSVRFATRALDHRPAGPGRHQVEILLEEDL